jgi:hypothetical protein
MWVSCRVNLLKNSMNLRRFSTVNTAYYDGSDIQFEYCKAQLKKLYLTMKNMEEERFFDYEKKQAKYDPKTGKIELLSIRKKPDTKIIKNFDDMQVEREKLHKELKLTTDDVLNASQEELAERYTQLYDRTQEGYHVDKSDFYAESFDNMRVDCGVIIKRKPIFVFYPEQEHEYKMSKTKILNEYNLDIRQYYKDAREETSLIDDLFARNPYVAITNRDNIPSHEIKAEDGSVKKYAAASKNWKNVDPSVTDRKSLHYGAQQLTYLLLKNKYTGDWEFPTITLSGTDSFIKSRRDLFAKLTGNKWVVRHTGNLPTVSTIRPFSEHEKYGKFAHFEGC